MGSIPAKKTYSGSRVSAIIGLNQHQTQLEAWQNIMEEFQLGFNAEKGYKLPEKPEGPALRWGHAFEDAVIKLAEEREGCKFFNKEELYKKEIGNITLSCHVDAKIRPGEYHEGKTTNTRAFKSNKTEIKESLDDSGMLNEDFEVKRKWGEPGTDQVPEEYQVQGAVQRICTGSNLVKLSVLVFPKTQQEFEDDGWVITYGPNENQILIVSNDFIVSVLDWARPLAQMGFFHSYNLPSNPELETAIISTIQDFHKNHVLTGLPPQPKNYEDIRRLLTNPQGTIIAGEELKNLSVEYSEITRQLGASGPMSKRKAALKVEIMTLAMQTKKDSWVDPPDKIVILDPDGGGKLASFSKSGFRTGSAK